MEEKIEIDFDEIETTVVEDIEAKETEEKTTTSEKKSITSGWTKGPFIVGGIIAAVMIAISVYILYIW